MGVWGGVRLRVGMGFGVLSNEHCLLILLVFPEN